MIKKLILFAFLFSVMTVMAYAQTYILLMGAPASGKGTFASYLKQNKDFAHLCLGDMLRYEIDVGSELGMIIKGYIESGDLVPNEILFKLFEEHFVNEVSANKNIIVDGMVQSLDNVQFFDDLLDKFGIKENCHYVYLKVDYNTAIERLLSRLVCKNCNEGYSRTDGLEYCRVCGSELITRIDDHEKTILKRLNRFFENGIHLVDMYRSRSKFYEFDSNRPLDDLKKDYKINFLDK